MRNNQQIDMANGNINMLNGNLIGNNFMANTLMAQNLTSNKLLANNISNSINNLYPRYIKQGYF